MSIPFLWGAATSSHQVEGYNTRNDWWEWEKAGNIEGGVSSGRATDHWVRFREDIRLAREIGLNSYRFSVEWSRLEPGRDVWDQDAFDWYRELVNECEKNHLVPMLTLHHFTTPKWLSENGGWTNSEAPYLFFEYVKRLHKVIGPHIPYWCTLNEPLVVAIGGYLGGFMPPGIFDPSLVGEVSRNLLKAHVLAYDFLHAHSQIRHGPFRQFPLMVGLANNMIDFLPDRRFHPIEIALSKVFHKFYNLSWLDAITGRPQHFGVRGIIPRPREFKKARNRKTVDFIGVNYYTKGLVQWRPRTTGQNRLPSLPLGLRFAKPFEEKSDLDWAIHPEGFRRVLNCATSYGLPVFVTENGIADKTDILRRKFLRQHLEVLDELREQKKDIRGYFHWSLIDNFEWIKGFGPRFGLYKVNYETYERSKNNSADDFKNFISESELG